MGEGRPAGRDHRSVKPLAKEQPLRLVVGFSPGSASDRIAKAIAGPLAERLGRPVHIELRPGSNGADAAQEVAASVADGQTLFVATLGTHALAPHLAARLSYDPLADFAPVSLLARAPLLLACHPSVPAGSTRELIDLARARPRELSYATSAIGGAPHLAAELFQAMAEIEMRHVRFDRTEALYQELEAGSVSLSFNNMMSMLPRCRDGVLRPLGITTSERSEVAPDLPAIAEAGLPGYDVANWLGVVAPKHTPPAVLRELATAMSDAVQCVAVAGPFRAAGVTPCGSTAEEFGRFMAAEIERWKPLVMRFKQAKV
jgi:tripartite-type tricarboxylate transporter receptor subunit TctC